MNVIASLLPIVGAILIAFAYAQRVQSHNAARDWALSWVAIFLSGVASTFPAELVIVRAGGDVFGVLSAFLMLRGSLEFVGRRTPGWLARFTLAVSVARGSLWLADQGALAAWVPLGFQGPVVAASAWVLIQHARRPGAGPAERIIGPVTLGLALLRFVDPFTRGTAVNTNETLLAWMSLAVPIAILQLVAIFDRFREAETDALASARSQSSALASERRTLEAVLEAAPLGILVIDGDRRISLVNSELRRQIGIERDWIGQPPERLLADLPQWMIEDPAFQRAVAVEETALSRARLTPIEVASSAPEGPVIALYSRAISGEDGNIGGEIWITHDITAERRLEAQLRQAQQLEVLGTLAGGVAHDFNNQLTAVLGNAEMIRGEDLTPSGAASLRDLEAAAAHCADLTRNLLTFARRAPLEARPVDVAQAVGDVAALLRASIPSRVELVTRVDLATPPVLVDPTQLKQILINLVVNAREAIPEQGTITVRAALAPDEGGRTVELSVEDDGIGMDRVVRERIFDPFFSTKSAMGGIGMGLAVVYGAVTAHGGEIEVSSQPDVGSVFRLRLPAAPSTQTPFLPEAAPRGAPGRTVLVVDDEPSIRRVCELTLRAAGFDVFTAGGGHEALALAEKHLHELDFALVDLQMPDLDGMAVIDALHALRPDLAASLMSGRPEAHALARTFECLHKPFLSGDLIAHIEACLAARSAGNPGADS